MTDPLPTQHDLRRARISRALDHAVTEVVASPRAFGYRARVLLRPDASGALGYHPPRSHDVLPISHCPIARPEVDAVLQALPPAFAGLAGVELRSDGTQVVLAARSKKRHGRKKRRGRSPGGGGAGPGPAALARLMDDAPLAGVVLDGKVLAGDGHTSLTVAGIPHRLRPDTFYQVNLEVNALLVAAVGAAVRDVAPTRILDLYAGAGNLSLPLANDAPVTLIEQAPSAVADANDAVKRLGLSERVALRRGDAGAFQAGDAFFDVVILDPPRAGAPGVIEQLLLTRPRRIVYVSCNAAALARDIRPARAAGYTFDRVAFFDMFPHTHHAEVLCVLDRP